MQHSKIKIGTATTGMTLGERVERAASRPDERPVGRVGSLPALRVPKTHDLWLSLFEGTISVYQSPRGLSTDRHRVDRSTESS